MIRLFELLVSIVIVFLLAVLIAAFLPNHGHIERVVEISSPVRQVYDSLSTFRRFPEWSSLRAMDPRVQMTLSGHDFGVGAKVSWTGNEKVGNGNLEIITSEQDKQVVMAITNDWAGTNKTYTVRIEPTANGKTLKIRWAYDADYGWNLAWRYAGLYIHGDPATMMQMNLNNMAAMLASFPNVDYKDQKIDVVDVAVEPLLVVSTRSKRTLDEVVEATDKAMAEIDAVLKKTGLQATGPHLTITTNWGDEEYVFDIAVPVDNATFKLNDQDSTITDPIKSETSGNDSNTPKIFNLGDRDDDGYLVVEGNVRAVLSHGGKALLTQYTGSPAVLPVLRLMLKTYAETHGYAYSEADVGRFRDEVISDPKTTPEDQQLLNVYLPIQL